MHYFSNDSRQNFGAINGRHNFYFRLKINRWFTRFERNCKFLNFFFLVCIQLFSLYFLPFTPPLLLKINLFSLLFLLVLSLFSFRFSFFFFLSLLFIPYSLSCDFYYLFLTFYLFFLSSVPLLLFCFEFFLSSFFFSNPNFCLIF